MPTTPRTQKVSAFLEKIIVATRARVDALRQENSFEGLLQSATTRERRSLSDALRAERPAIIAEIKKASPSKGVFQADFDPLRLAAAYRLGGAAAISVVTEPEFFQGNPAWINQVHHEATLPILRKDFILDPIQVAESASLGADAILLIARILTAAQMCELRDAASHCELEVLFEAHDAADLENICQYAPSIVGINARNLDKFHVDRDKFRLLSPMIPETAIRVAESGIETPEDVQACLTLGYSSFLIGGALIRSTDPASLLRQLKSAGNRS